MICEGDGGCYLFMYDTEQDGPCRYDSFLENLEDAEHDASFAYGVRAEDWQFIPDYLEGCQQDWIAPTKKTVDADGKAQFARVGEAS